jgi:hypothetical protein
MQVSQGWPGGVKRSVKYADVDANRRRVKNLDMTIVEITGGMLRAARSLTGLSQQELADRASISRGALSSCRRKGVRKALRSSTDQKRNRQTPDNYRPRNDKDRAGIFFHP